jgi:hypothetical protein
MPKTNVALLKINSRDNSPLLVRGDIGALAQRQQQNAQAVNKRKDSNSRWTLEISPF